MMTHIDIRLSVAHDKIIRRGRASVVIRGDEQVVCMRTDMGDFDLTWKKPGHEPRTRSSAWSTDHVEQMFL